MGIKRTSMARVMPMRHILNAIQRRSMMYHGTSQFGKAYQDVLLREAGVFDEQDLEIRRLVC
jgi:hypothetical protein